MAWVFILNIAIVLWIDFRYFISMANLGMSLGYVAILLVFSLLSLCVVFPIYSQYELSLDNILKMLCYFH